MFLNASSNNFLNGTGLIPTASSEVVDSIDLTKTKYAKWFVYIEGVAKSQAFEILAVARGVNVNYTVYALVGDFVSYTIDIDSDGTNMDFTITNNEPTTISVKLKRLIT